MMYGFASSSLTVLCVVLKDHLRDKAMSAKLFPTVRDLEEQWVKRSGQEEG